MERTMNDREIWSLLSYFFVDNDIDYKFIANNIKGYSLTDINYRLFYEVAPICAHNLSNPIPLVWIFFDIDTIAPLIEEHTLKYRKNIIYKLKVNILASYYNFKYKLEWLELEREIIAVKTNGHNL